jgi:hypothetical protein
MAIRRRIRGLRKEHLCGSVHRSNIRGGKDKPCTDIPEGLSLMAVTVIGVVASMLSHAAMVLHSVNRRCANSVPDYPGASEKWCQSMTLSPACPAQLVRTDRFASTPNK